MSEEKQYFDADGNSIGLYKLVRSEPEWAQSRIKAGEHAIKERDTYRELCGELLLALAYHQAQTRPIQGTIEAITKAESILGENNAT